MRQLHAFPLLVLAMSAVACGKTPDASDIQRAEVQTPVATHYSSSVGWLHGNCLAIMNTDLAPGTILTIVQPDQPPRVSTATLAERTHSSETCKALLGDRRQINIASGYTFYSVHAKPEINLGIAVLGNKHRAADYQFDYCATREGLLFTMKTGPQQGRAELWRGYYYLGYDSDITCPSERVERLTRGTPNQPQ